MKRANYDQHDQDAIDKKRKNSEVEGNGLISIVLQKRTELTERIDYLSGVEEAFVLAQQCIIKLLPNGHITKKMQPIIEIIQAQKKFLRIFSNIIHEKQYVPLKRVEEQILQQGIAIYRNKIVHHALGEWIEAISSRFNWQQKVKSQVKDIAKNFSEVRPIYAFEVSERGAPIVASLTTKELELVASIFDLMEQKCRSGSLKFIGSTDKLPASLAVELSRIAKAFRWPSSQLSDHPIVEGEGYFSKLNEDCLVAIYKWLSRRDFMNMRLVSKKHQSNIDKNQRDYYAKANPYPIYRGPNLNQLKECIDFVKTWRIDHLVYRLEPFLKYTHIRLDRTAYYPYLEALANDLSNYKGGNNDKGSFYLSIHGLCNDEMAQHVERLHFLTELRLRAKSYDTHTKKYTISNISAKGLQHFRSLKKLKKLTLSDNININPEFIKAVSELTSLTELAVDYTNSNSHTLECIKHLSKLKELRKIKWQNERYTTEWIRFEDLAYFEQFKHLTHLDIQISRRDMYLEQSLEQPIQSLVERLPLTHLSLTNGQFYAKDMQDLANGLEKAKNLKLKYLNLSYRWCTGGIQPLLELAAKKNIKVKFSMK